VAGEPVDFNIGKYHCDEMIGSGGMANVYRATDTESKSTVAVKVLHRILDSKERERFRKEAGSLALLQHPGIVKTYASDLQGLDNYLVMEYLDGPTLRGQLDEFIDRDEHVPIPEVRRIAQALFDALRYAHGNDVVHRDIKPTNIILGSVQK